MTETCSLREWDETWNFRDRDSQNWASRRFLRPRPSLETPSLLIAILHVWIGNTIGFLTDNLLHMLCLVFAFRYLMQLQNQARRQDFAEGGGKTTKGAQFLNTILDVCSNRGVLHEMLGTNFEWGAGHHWPPLWRRPCSRMSIQSCYFCVLDVEMVWFWMS